MKKITLLLIMCLGSLWSYSQCLTSVNGQWPATTFALNTSNCDGFTVQNVTTCGYASEYSVVTVTLGQTYVFRSSNATDIVTISTDGGATSAAFGTGSVTWVSTIAGNVRFYTHLNATCAAESVCRTKTVTCGIVSPDAPDYANLQFPATASIVQGGSVTVYGQVYEGGLTDVAPNIAGQAPGIQVWVGTSATNTNPNTWTNWTAATWNAGQISNNDEYQANIGATLAPGTYYYATRIRLNSGAYFYGGINANAPNNGNFWDGVTFGSGVLTVNPAPPPTNDNFATPIAVNCGNTYTGDTSLPVTLDEDNAPDGFGADMDAPNLWYSFTGNGTAQTVTLSLCNSSYDTSVLVYTGTSGNLTLVAANDDFASCNATNDSVNSKVIFTSDGTTTYYIAVEGWNVGNVGAFAMDVSCSTVTPPAVANQDCGTALNVQVNGLDNNSDNSFGTVSSAQPSCDLFGSIQDVWFSFVAPASGNVTCLVTPGTMTSMNFNIYSGACGALTAVTGTCNSNLTVATSEVLTGLTPNNIYFVQVWSNSAEQGTFALRLSDDGLGNNSFDNSNFSYYPNPVKNTLNLSYNQEISNVEIFNLIGQKVSSNVINANQGQVDMSNLSNGVYLVKVTSNNQVKTIRVIKE